MLVFNKSHKNGLVRQFITGIVMFANIGALTADELGETNVFWAHNYQFFSYDYRLGATLQNIGEHANLYVENAVVLSNVTLNDTIYIGTAHGGIFKRNVSDATWINISQGLPDDPVRGGYSAINAIVINTAGWLIAGTDGGIYTLPPADPTWNASTVTEPIFDLLSNGNDIYAATGHYLWDDTNGDLDADGDLDVDLGVRFSSDGGQNWSDLSAGLPVDEEDETLPVNSLAKTGSTIFAATPAGTFQLTAGAGYWQAPARPLTLSTPQITVKLSESARDEAEGWPGWPEVRAWRRWLTVDINDISTETELTITLSPSNAGILDTLSQWFCRARDDVDAPSDPTDAAAVAFIRDGILGDDGKYFVELSSMSEPSTKFYNVSAFFAGYDTISPSNMKYLNEDSVATVINPRNEVLLLTIDAADPAYPIGGQFTTVTYNNGVDIYKWSSRVNMLREPNKEKMGILLSAESLVFGENPDYTQLNRTDQIQYFSATTFDVRYNFSVLKSSLDGIVLYGATESGILKSTDDGVSWSQVGPDFYETVYDIYADQKIYLGAASGVYQLNTTENSWDLLPYVLPFTPVPTRTINILNDNLVAGGEFGFFKFSDTDSTWYSDNLQLYGYITAVEIDTLMYMMDSSTPADPNLGIYDVITNAYGADRLPDIDGSDIITILIHNLHDISEPWNNTSNGQEGGADQIRGYIRNDDQSLVGRTNRRDMVYIDSKGRGSNVVNLLADRIANRGGSLAHQLMRLMILNSDPDEERWIAEGIAFSGEKLCGFEPPSRWIEFPQKSGQTRNALSLVTGTPLIGWQVNPQNGSVEGEQNLKVALWMTYLEENFGGMDFIRALMDEPANGIEGINTLLADVTTTTGSALTFSDVFTSWSIANAINDTTLSNPETGLRYGYLDEDFSAMINTYMEGDGAGLGVGSGNIFFNMMEDYEQILQKGSYTDGLNNWATDFRTFFYVEGTGSPQTWENKVYHFNGADANTFRVFLLKYQRDAGYVIEDLTALLSDENELQFRVLDEFGPNSDTTEFEFDRLVLGVSNQTLLGGSARFVETTDVTPPEIGVSIVHNAFFPEFLSVYVYTNEHLHADVDETENPVVLVADELDTNRVEMTFFHDLADTADDYSGSLYNGEIQLARNQTLDLIMESVQDLAGNDTMVTPVSISVLKVTDPQGPQKIVSKDKRFAVTFPGNTISKDGFVTMVAESPAIYSKLNGIDQAVFGDVRGCYTVGPSALALENDATVNIDLEGWDSSEKLGLYKIEGTSLIPIPAVMDISNSSISANIRQLGTFIIAKNAGITDETTLTPESYELEQNFPNPFNPSTTIGYRLANPGRTKVKIYNLLGKEVITLVDKFQISGGYSVQWYGQDQFGQKVGSGVYLYRIQSGNFHEIRKMLIIK